MGERGSDGEFVKGEWKVARNGQKRGILGILGEMKCLYIKKGCEIEGNFGKDDKLVDKMGKNVYNINN